MARMKAVPWPLFRMNEPVGLLLRYGILAFFATRLWLYVFQRIFANPKPQNSVGESGSRAAGS